MAEVTVKQFAEVVGTSVERLLEQLTEAGVPKDNADATISDSEKMELLNFLRHKHGAEDAASPLKEPKKITLKRKSTSELRQVGTHGKSKSVSVEVRKKRTYVKRSVVQEEESERLEKERAEREKLDAEKRAQEEIAKKNLEHLLLSAFRALPHGSHMLIESIPGIGEATAAILVAKIISIDRFETPKSLVGYFGVFPKEDSSGVDKFGNLIPPGTMRMSSLP